MAFNDPPRGYPYPNHHQTYSPHHTRFPSTSHHPMSLILNTDEPRHQFQHDRSKYPLPSPTHIHQQPYHHDNLSNRNDQHSYSPIAQPLSSQYRERERESYVPVNRSHEIPASPVSLDSSRRPSTIQTTRALPISGLLSAEPSPTISPAPVYSIRVRQQPAAARACGFGERDRRVIDPPPILQMHVDSPTSTKEEISAMLRNYHAVVHCTLWDPVADVEDAAMPGTNDKKQQRRLMGTLVASAFVALDEHNVEGCFFTFADLSIRTPGRYALRFSLVILDLGKMQVGGSAKILSSAMTVPFQVYNAKDFSGMRASSELTKKLKYQGCLISVKKGNARTNAMDGHQEDDEEDDFDDDHRRDEDEGGARKRAKRVQLAPAPSPSNR